MQVRARDGRVFDSYFRDCAQTPAPCIIVLQEIFGVNAYIRGLVDRYAELGFIAAAPDLFWRQAPGLQLDPADEADRSRGMQLLKSLDEAAAMQDIASLSEALRDMPGCNGKVGVVGYCMGGKLAYLAAQQGADAGVSYYGVGIQGALDSAPAVNAPLLLHLAAEDPLCPPDAQKRIVEAFAGNPLVEIEVHAKVGHAFARGGPSFDSQATQRADDATIAMLRSVLE